MSGLLRPVGAESTWTYWVRRALVVGVIAVAITLVVAAVRALGTPAPTQAVPPPMPTNSSSSPDAPKPTPTSSPTATPSTSPLPSTSSTPTPSPKPSTSPSPNGSASPGPTPTPTAPSPTPPPKPVACETSDLRLTLIGKRTVRAEQDSSYQLSVINGGKESCVVTVDQATFQLAITSGTDPIWSSQHCDRTLEPTTKTLASEEAVAWTMTWNGERSRQDCKNSSDTPRPGIYWATADLDGAEPVKWRMTVEG